MAKRITIEHLERDDDDDSGTSVRSWKLEVDPGFIFVRMNHGDGFILLRAADIDAFVEDLRQAQQISVDLLEVKK